MSERSTIPTEIGKNNLNTQQRVAVKLGKEAIGNGAIYEKLEYEKSEINWDRIQQLAKYVASNTKRPFSHYKACVEEYQEKTIPCGFLNLSTKKVRISNYTLGNLPGDYWVIYESNLRRTYTPREVNEATEDQYECVSYCLGSNGKLFQRNQSWREIFDPVGVVRFLYANNKVETTDTPLNVNSINIFDFERKIHQSKDNNLEIYHDGGVSEKLIHKSKGDGLLSLLSELL